jgi:predicted RNA-binding Zn-ribbon protein involved in translation (DUF1610 family)
VQYNPELWDFIMEGGYELLFPEDEERSYQCPYCGRIINGDEKVRWLDRMKTIFQCPECEEKIEIR